MKARFIPRSLASGLIAILLLSAGCHRRQAPATPPPPTVTAQQPTRQEVIEWDEYPGRLTAVDMVEVRARVSGYLESIHFQEGAMVRKGDLLCVIDPRPFEAELAKQQAAMVQAQTRLEWSSNEVARAERLVKSRAISEEEADSRNKAQTEAQAGIQSARAAVDVAKLNLEYTRIIAPISGRIGRKLITEGNLVNGNQGQSTVLTTIVSLDPIYGYFDADEHSVLKYQQMSREGTGLRMGEVPCELELANEKDFPHKGRLDFVDNRVNPETGTLRVRGIFSNPAPNYALLPGFFCRVRVPGSGKYSAVLIPEQAIGTDQGRKFVYVAAPDDSLEYKPVELGPLLSEGRVIRQGIGSNDWVVVNGLMGIRPGVKVKVDRARAAAAAREKPDGATK